MKNAKRRWLLLAAALVILGAALCRGAYAAMGYDLTKLNSETMETSSYKIEVPFSKISIKASDAKVVLLPSEGKTCWVQCTSWKNEPYTAEVIDRTLTIQPAKSPILRLWWFAFGEPSILLYLPNSCYEQLNIETGSGNMDLPQDFTFSNAQLKSSSGHISLESKVEKKLSAKTSSGYLLVNGVSCKEMTLLSSSGNGEVCYGGANRLQIKSSSGEISLSYLTCGELEAEASSGDISLTGVQLSGDLKVNTTSGTISLNICDAGSLKLKSSSGTIFLTNCDADSLELRSSSGDILGSLLSDKRFITKSSSGRIQVPETTSGGVCKVETSSGDIRFRIVP